MPHENRFGHNHLRPTKVYHRYDFTDPANATIPNDIPNRDFNNTTITTLDDLGILPPSTSVERQLSFAGRDIVIDGKAGRRRRKRPERPVTPVSSVSTPVSSGRFQGPLIDQYNDVRVKVGGEVFWHSSVVLRCASPILARYFTPVLDTTDSNDDNNEPHKALYELDFSHRPAYEWKCLSPFLEPHACQAAVVTPHHLVAILKWLEELELKVLLDDCDKILSSLEWNWSRSTPRQHVHDLILVSQVAGKSSNLPTTLDTVWKNWNQLFWQAPEVVCDLEILQGLAKLLSNSAMARQVFWLTLIRYLPADLVVFSNPQKELVENPLFPYLLREGLQKHIQSVIVCQPDSKNDVSADTTPSDEGGTDDGTAAFDERDILENDVRDWQASFQEWWNAWSNISHSKQIRGMEKLLYADIPKTCPKVASMVCPANRIPSDLQAPFPSPLSAPPGLSLPPDRSEWLDQVWQHLQGEPILPQTASILSEPSDESQEQTTQSDSAGETADACSVLDRRSDRTSRRGDRRKERRQTRKLSLDASSIVTPTSSRTPESNSQSIRPQRKFLC